MSLEMAQKVIVPQKNYVPQFLKQRDINSYRCTDKKENQIFLIYKEIQNGAIAKSYMTNGLLIYG